MQAKAILHIRAQRKVPARTNREEGEGEGECGIEAEGTDKAERKGESRKNSGRSAWLQQFCAKGGLRHVFQALLTLPITSIAHPLARKCFALLLKFLCIIQATEPAFEKFIPHFEDSHPLLVERVLALLRAFAQHSVSLDPAKSFRTPRKPRLWQPSKAEDKGPKPADAQAESRALIKERAKQLEESSAFEHGFQLLGRGMEQSLNDFKILAQSPHLKQLLLDGLLKSDNKYMQSILSKEILGVCRRFLKVPIGPGHPHQVLLPYLLEDLVLETTSQTAKCQEFYRLLCALVGLLSRDGLKSLGVNYHEKFQHLAEMLCAHEIKEVRSSDTDDFLVGLFELLGALLRKFPDEKHFVGQSCGVVGEILGHCLFEYPKPGSRKLAVGPLPPKCKSVVARQAAFSLLCTLARDTPANLAQIVDYLLPIHVYGPVLSSA